MATLANERVLAAWRLISDGDPAGALAVARAVVADTGAVHPIVRVNCAGVLIDAGERLDNESAIRDGIAILDALRDDATFPEAHRDDLRYNFANGKSALIHMAHRRVDEPDEQVRDLSAEEEVVAIYYDASDALRRATPEQVINCAAMLRLQGRIHEAIDLLDHVLRRDQSHPNAHMQMADMLWSALHAVRWRDDLAEALLVPALVHYARAAVGFDKASEPEFAASTRRSAGRCRALADRVLKGHVDERIAEIGDRVLGADRRFGAPLGLSLLARSPYRDEDDPWLVEDLRADLRDICVDAAGAFAVGRDQLLRARRPSLNMPRWGAATPDAAVQLRHSAVRQCGSVLDKVAWLINSAFDAGLSERECAFAVLFWEPTKKGTKASTGTSRAIRGKLARRNPGLRALAGLACAFDAERGVYAPLKRLRNAVEHRGASEIATTDDAAFLLGIARAALLHAVDSIVFEAATAPAP